MSNAAAIPVDFPDWLSPMVVKEVRQGLRGWLFVALFFLLHGTLLLWVAATSDARSPSSAGESDTFFWMILAVGIGVIVSRGMNALHGERNGNTMELLQLTRLSAWRIVAGKWTALMVQLGLFLTSLLPYGLLRYYLGALNAASDTWRLVLFFGLGAALAALAVYLSCLKRWLGWAVWLGIFALLLALLGEFEGKVAFAGMWDLLAGLLFSLGVATALFLMLGASVFAPVTDGLAVRKRLLGFLLLLPPAVIMALGKAGRSNELVVVLFLLAFLLLAFLAADAVASPSATTPAAVKGFECWGIWGRLAALVLAPNRLSALVYAVLIWAGVTGLFFWILREDLMELRKLIGFALVMGNLAVIVFIAAGLAYIAPRRWRHGYALRFWIYGLGLIGIGLACVTFTDVAPSAMKPLWETLNLVTPIGVFYQWTDKAGDSGFLPASLLVAMALQWTIALALLCVPMLHEFKNLRRLLRGEHLDFSP